MTIFDQCREGPGGDGPTHSHFAPLRVRMSIFFLLVNFEFRMTSEKYGTTHSHSHFAPLRVRVLAPSALSHENTLGMKL